jgi:hypothetical protein
LAHRSRDIDESAAGLFPWRYVYFQFAISELFLRFTKKQKAGDAPAFVEYVMPFFSC